MERVAEGRASGLSYPSSSLPVSATASMLSVTQGMRSISEFAFNIVPDDEWQIDSNDDHLEFFQKGRDYQPRKQKHHFTEEEKGIMATFDSTAIKPSHTAVYRHWLATLPPRSDSESWLIIVFIALIIGILTFFMKVICERLQIFYNPFMENFVVRGETVRLWMYYSVMSCTCGVLSALIIIYICPQAGGSGVPEIIGVLNGCIVRNVLSVRTLVCKTVSCMFTVISSLPVGFEGPMFYDGALRAMVAATMARPCHCPSCKDNIYLERPPRPNREGPCKRMADKICRYRDCQERHNLICVGSAAGVASAFSSPITGLCYAMEELSTHWTLGLTWQTFVCCIVARSTTELLHSVTSTIEHKTNFELSEAALFDMKVHLKLGLTVFIPAVIIGILGGVLGSLYIFMHLKMAKFRRRMLNKIKRTDVANAFKVLEVIFACMMCSSFVMTSMSVMDCHRVNHSEPVSSDNEIRSMVLKNFSCRHKVFKGFDHEKSAVRHIGDFHEGATLLFGSYEQMIRNLLSRRTPDFFSAKCLSIIFVFFFVFSSWSAILSIASGLLVPQLAIGSLYGRLVGKLLHDLLKEYMGQEDADAETSWDFTDPGAMALLGAAAFFAGTSRQAITAVVMMAEMTNDVNMSLSVMVAVMLAKFVGDRFTHSLVHSLLEFKCIPILEPELKIYHNNTRVDLELFPISLVMRSDVKQTSLRSSVHFLANLLISNSHGAFPVIKSAEVEGGKNVFIGLISRCGGIVVNVEYMDLSRRMELTILLTKTDGFDVNELNKEDIDKIRITYPEYTSTKLKDCAITNRILQMYSSDTRYEQVFVNLYPYINLSAYTVTTTFSLHRCYVIFRDMGLRHLVVVDEYNEVQGIVTRKDLLGFEVEEKVKDEMRNWGHRIHNWKKSKALQAWKSRANIIGKIITAYRENSKGLPKSVVPLQPPPPKATRKS